MKSQVINFIKHPKVKLFFKLLITGAALYFVFQKIPFEDILGVVKAANIPLLLLATILFNLSKIISAFRLNTFYKAVAISLSDLKNIKLYYLGMFYNLFLPGGIGGDGYKVYLLKQAQGGSTKQLINATLVDRLSGLAALSWLIGLLLFFSTLGSLPWVLPLSTFLLISPFLVLWVIMRVLAKYLIPALLTTSLLSLAVQVTQLLCSICLLYALGVEKNFIEYLILFLVSSAVSVLPFTLGGVGARELVFVYGYEYLPIEAETALAFSLLFFAITALSSLLGLVFVRNVEQSLAVGEG